MTFFLFLWHSLVSITKYQIMEEWKIISDAPNYEISSHGNVRRRTACNTAPAGFILKRRVDVNGYYQVTLSHEGKYLYRTVHRLVALAFLGNPPSPLHEVAHNDGIRLNVFLSNLRWATKQENMADRAEHGLWTPEFGEGHHGAVLTDALVIQMRKERSLGDKITEIAKRHGVAKLTAYDAITGKTWRHING